MKLRVLGPNQTEVELTGECGLVSVLFSYNTPVAAQLGELFYVTEKKYSTTTTKHINSWLPGSGLKGTIKKPQSFFDNLFEVTWDLEKEGGAK